MASQAWPGLGSIAEGQCQGCHAWPAEELSFPNEAGMARHKGTEAQLAPGTSVLGQPEQDHPPSRLRATFVSGLRAPAPSERGCPAPDASRQEPRKRLPRAWPATLPAEVPSPSLPTQRMLRGLRPTPRVQSQRASEQGQARMSGKGKID